MNAFKKFVGDDNSGGGGGGGSDGGSAPSLFGGSSSATAPAAPGAGGLGGFFGGGSSSASAAVPAPAPASATGLAIPGLPAALGGKGAASGVPDASQGGLFGTDDGCFKLTKTQRMMAFASCFGVGMLFSFLGTMNLAKPTSFAILYSLGNITSLLSTGFMVGFKRQCRYAFERKRIIATLIYLVALIATLLTALLYKGGGVTALCIFLIAIQFCALVWYTASYIPFAQQAISSFTRSLCGRAMGAGGGGG
jgi:hypothetical protein